MCELKLTVVRVGGAESVAERGGGGTPLDAIELALIRFSFVT